MKRALHVTTLRKNQIIITAEITKYLLKFDFSDWATKVIGFIKREREREKEREKERKRETE